MNRTQWFLFFLIVMVFSSFLSVMAEADQEQVVYWVPIEQSIEQGLAQFLKRSLAEAEEDGAKAINLKWIHLVEKCRLPWKLGKCYEYNSTNRCVYKR